MSQVQMQNGETVEQAEGFEGNTISTRAPKAVEKGKKPAGWVLTLPNPVSEMTLEDMLAEFGEAKVMELAKASYATKFQAAVRTMAEQGRPDEEIERFMVSEWKPGVKIQEVKLTPEEAILKNFGNMSPEQQAKLIDILAKRANG